MKKTLAYIVLPNECEELRKYFGITEEELSKRGFLDEDNSKKLSEKGTMKKMECLLTIIEEKGHMNPYNINNLTDAVSTLGDEMHVSNMKGPIEGYELHGTLFWLSLKYNDLKGEMSANQKAWEDERNQLITELQTANSAAEEQRQTLDDLQDELVHVTKQSDEQSFTLWEVLQNAQEEIEELQGEKATLTDELEMLKHTLDINKNEVTTLTEKLEQTKAEATKEIETLSEQLVLTNQSLDLSRKESTRKIATLTGEITSSKTESTKGIETLTEKIEQTGTKSAKEIETSIEELKQTKQSLDLNIKESTNNMETLTEELQQTRMKYTKEIDGLTEMRRESAEKIKALIEELEQTRTKSTKDIETLTDELKQTKHSFDLNKKESTNNIETLTEELQQTRMKYTKKIDDLTRMRRESAEKIKALTEELEQTRTKSKKEIETLTDELKQTKQSFDLNSKGSTKNIETLTEELQQTRTKYTKEIKELAQMRTESSENIQRLLEELEQTKQSLELAKIESTNEIETLTTELNETKQKLVTRMKELGTVNKDQEVTKNVLRETKRDRDITRSDVKQYQPDLAKESKVLKEVLNQTKEAMAELQKRAVEDKPSVDSEENRDEGVSMLAAEFGRLIVGTADSLTLDQSLQLAMLFSLPPSVSDALCRVSLFQSPGMRLLEEIRNRNIINMYDVTNLQKAFAVLKLENIKQNLLDPYQESVEDELHELHRTEEMLTWEDVEALNAKIDKTAVFQLEYSKIPPQKGAVEGLDESSQAEAMTQHSETRVKDSVPSQRGGHQYPAYSEHNIGRQGGIIHLADASLTIPPDAILESHVIGFTVADEIPFPLPREDDNTRMTPLIKLEPLGLIFKKSLQLTIPHSALIPEPEKHGVIIFSGQIPTKTDGFSDIITWTEERSLLRQLKEKTLTLNIHCLSYIFASLMSQSSEPSSCIVRAVPFVDGVRNDDDDIILTVCLCGDNESEYSMLLSDYQTKLPLEQYSTLHLSRHSRTDDKDKDVLRLTISSPNNSYKPDMQQELVKDIVVSHLFSASRVSHQFRLKKNQQIDSDFVDLVLTISQDGNKLTEIFLKTRIKDLMISQKIEDLLLSSVPPGISEDVSAPQLLLKKQQIRALSSRNDQSVQTVLSSSCVTCDLDVKTLTNEGYAEQEVVEALDIAKNRLHLARGILEYIGDQRVSLPKGNIFLYKEQYIDENGGEITLREADIHMLIPVGAVSKGSIVSITTMTSKHVNVPSEGRTPQLTPVIKCGQEGLALNKPVSLRIPHCASETEGITSIDMYFGFSSKGEEVQWRKRRQLEPSPFLKNDHFEVLLQTFCTISFHVAADYNKRLKKSLRLLPLINRIANPSDDLTVTLWIYNDDETEHMHLFHEEITKGGKIQLHDFKRFTLKGSGRDKEVYIRSGNSKIKTYPNANIKNFTPTTLWHNTRHSAEFHFQNKEEIGDIAFTLKLYTKHFLKTSDDLQFDLKVTLPELLQEPRESTRAVIKIQGPQPAMEKSFQELIRKLSRELGVDSCLEIAGIFGLSSNFRDRLKESSEPGDVLFDELIHKQLISSASVSVLDVALTRTGNVRLAKDVKEYRRRNATFPTTIFTLF